MGSPRVRPGTRPPLWLVECTGRWSAWVGRAGHPRGVCAPVVAAWSTEACRALSESFGNCALEMLAEGVSSARLETRTKESNVYASWWAENPRSARNLTGARAPVARSIDLS